MAHIVESGDSFWSIAARYNLSLADLLAYNGLTEDSFLGIGDQIVIVSPTPTVTPTPPPTSTPVLAETAVLMPSSPFPTPAQQMPSRTPLPKTAVSATPASASAPSDIANMFGIGAMAFGVGLVMIALVGLVYFRKD
ncbi:MAG: LysM peptidoglycan-binding domain-containing protein [Chloroflexi bacterium]|nr:LysM peptidoglycan-binding domain-containing protein [Chloroflexota bacterium]